MTVTIDMRSILPPVRDQGTRGTCLAFAVTALHEALRARRAQGKDDLAEEALYWGCKKIDGDWTTGTSFESASAALPRWGQPIGSNWPYDPRRLDSAPYDPPTTLGGADWFRAGLRQVDKTSSSVRTLLAGNFPVALGITLYPSFYRPSSTGHVADPQLGDPMKGRHAVVAVGFDGANILIRNSWGLLWGLSGYGWISDSYVDSHTNDMWTVDVNPSTLITNYDATTLQSEENTYGTS